MAESARDHRAPGLKPDDLLARADASPGSSSAVAK